MKILPILITVFIPITLFGQPTVSFTFDDGVTHDRSGYSFEEWNQMILNSLKEENLRAVFFVTGFNKSDKKGIYLLESWNSDNHLIGNHTFSHPNFNSSKIGSEEFKDELIRTDTIISKYSNYTKLFRFPYLKEGDTKQEVVEIRKHLSDQGYKNGYVTIDASDWYIDSRLRKRLKENPKANIEVFKDFYLEHLFERANYYENLSYELTGRHISHTLLLHHNLAAALFLDDLIAMFKSKGWSVISADEAFKDPIFDRTPDHAGESLIWALAKENGEYEDQLRYPAEDSRYEKERMDELGL
ncbi:polysaccharide deacetylase [Arenibacter algicola]|uniref:Polysaccharide deacetylase n=1 Tax=Arenibacter algicola TaxID=616991 RepID=A0ABY3A8B3_9FLAO